MPADVLNGRHVTTETQSPAELEEMTKLGVRSPNGMTTPAPPGPKGSPSVARRAVEAHGVLNEAYDYGSAFSRALAFDIADTKIVLVSGTASVDEKGDTVHVGDFRAQLWRTFRNITELLRAEGLTWHDVVRTTCYLRDIERDYEDFNEIRNAFYDWLGLDPLPASTAIQARICRSDLLVEIEAIAAQRIDHTDAS